MADGEWANKKFNLFLFLFAGGNDSFGVRVFCFLVSLFVFFSRVPFDSRLIAANISRMPLIVTQAVEVN